jgi:hypothetical protein
MAKAFPDGFANVFANQLLEIANDAVYLNGTIVA